MTSPYEEYVVTPVNELETKEQRDRRIAHERKVGAVFNHPRFRKRDPEDLYQCAAWWLNSLQIVKKTSGMVNY